EPAWSGSSLPTLVVQKKGLRVKYLSSALSGLAVIVALGAPFPHAALHPDLRPGDGVLDRSTLVVRHRAHPPGGPGRSAGRVVFAVQRPRGEPGVGQRERRLDAGGGRSADLR